MKTAPFILLFLLAPLLAACSTAQPTLYQPADGGRYGYAEEALIAPAFKLVFTGNRYTPRETVERYHLYRAAERSAALGYPRFALKDKVVERLVRETYDRYWGPYGGVGYGYGGRHGGASSIWLGVPLGAGAGPGYRAETYGVSALVVPFRGAPPSGVAGYHEVEQVLSALGPGIVRPGIVRPGTYQP